MKISVENLPNSITEERLKDVFGQMGEVQSVKLKTDLLTWQLNGQGVVDMTLEVDAYRAINCFEGAIFTDKKIHVKETYPLFEKAKNALEHITDGHSLSDLKPLASFERWKEQWKEY
ncbi:MAG: RNA-binding protein [Nitrospirae bacterium]|nr:RNA-binding protein [Nitrospirota bacterium]